MKFLQIFLLTVFSSTLLLSPATVSATSHVADPSYGLDKTANKAGVKVTFSGDEAEFPLAVIIGKIINSFLIMLGAIFLFLIILGGFTWMSAGGNEEKITKAKGSIMSAIQGIVITMVSYALAGVIISAVINSSSGQ